LKGRYKSVAGEGWAITVNDMSEQQQEYEEQPTIISKKLNRISLERIKRLGKHWEETFGVLKA